MNSATPDDTAKPKEEAPNRKNQFPKTATRKNQFPKNGTPKELVFRVARLSCTPRPQHRVTPCFVPEIGFAQRCPLEFGASAGRPRPSPSWGILRALQTLVRPLPGPFPGRPRAPRSGHPLVSPTLTAVHDATRHYTQHLLK